MAAFVLQTTVASSPLRHEHPMRLGQFILDNREPILAEWEAFARTCTPSSRVMDIDALRDHASEMLTVIVADLGTPQDDIESTRKSTGQVPIGTAFDALTAAEEHGAGRAESGFTVEQMVSEYRALRASVIRLWTKSQGKLEAEEMEDLTRFNEAIDQALAESVSQYALDLESSKEMFLAILGHDLRTPLGAIFSSARFMLETGELEEPHRTLTTRIASSATRMVQMVGDLLDFTRSRLGGGIPIVRRETNLGRLLHDVVDEICAAYPGRHIEIETRSDEKGQWDGDRIAQALTNLIGNAVEHSSKRTTVRVDVRGDPGGVAIAVHNRGAPIPRDQLNGIFNPLKARGSSTNAPGPHGNLGLGLYIAERIVHAHDGKIEVESNEKEGTTFTVHLPRADTHDLPRPRARPRLER